MLRDRCTATKAHHFHRTPRHADVRCGGWNSWATAVKSRRFTAGCPSGVKGNASSQTVTEGGARYLVATMPPARASTCNLLIAVNYDVPWKVRLEQRMGQTTASYGHDSDHINLVGKTREGKVLQTLLDKLGHQHEMGRDGCSMWCIGAGGDVDSDHMPQALIEEGGGSGDRSRGAADPTPGRSIEVEERASMARRIIYGRNCRSNRRNTSGTGWVLATRPCGASSNRLCHAGHRRQGLRRYRAVRQWGLDAPWPVLKLRARSAASA